MTRQLTEKSDVYSFGIVLLEVVTGHSAILQSIEPTHIVQWTRQHLVGGNIEQVVDARMQGDYNVNGLWKITDVALKCTAQDPAQRPTMTDVATQLQECLELESERAHQQQC
jgi:serine/threonine protein kinase